MAQTMTHLGATRILPQAVNQFGSIDMSSNAISRRLWLVGSLAKRMDT